MQELIRFRSEIILWAQAARITSFYTSQSPENLQDPKAPAKHPGTSDALLLLTKLWYSAQLHKDLPWSLKIIWTQLLQWTNGWWDGGKWQDSHATRLGSKYLPAVWHQDTLIRCSLANFFSQLNSLIFLKEWLLKQIYCVFIFGRSVVKSRLRRHESEPLHKQQGCISNR